MQFWFFCRLGMLVPNKTIEIQIRKIIRTRRLSAYRHEAGTNGLVKLSQFQFSLLPML